MNETRFTRLLLVNGLIASEDRVLLVRRHEPAKPYLHGMWELPGGKVESGESPAQACARELLEETGAVGQVGRLLPFVHAITRRTACETTDLTVLCFRCKLTSFNRIEPPPGISGIKWWNLDRLNPLYVQSGTFKFLRHLVKTKRAFADHRHISASLALRGYGIPGEKHRGVFKIRAETSMLARTPFRFVVAQGNRHASYASARIAEFNDREDAIAFLTRTVVRARGEGFDVADAAKAFPFLGLGQ